MISETRKDIMEEDKRNTVDKTKGESSEITKQDKFSQSHPNRNSKNDDQRMELIVKNNNAINFRPEPFEKKNNER